jgi:hypothetical protein
VSGGLSPFLHITDAGNVGIGTASPQSRLHVVNTANTLLQLNGNNTTAALDTGFTISADDSKNIYLYQRENAAAIFATNNAERMRITSVGDVSINTTESFAKQSVYSNDKLVQFIYHNGTNDNAGISIRHNRANLVGETGKMITFFTSGSNQVGSITSTITTTSYNVTSDYRLKEDLQEIKGLEKVLSLKVYNYKWKADESRMDGVLAHELAEVLPYAVQGQKDEQDEEGNDKMQSVDYSKIVPILIKAIQEQQEQIDSLKNQMK